MGSGAGGGIGGATGGAGAGAGFSGMINSPMGTGAPGAYPGLGVGDFAGSAPSLSGVNTPSNMMMIDPSQGAPGIGGTYGGSGFDWAGLGKGLAGGAGNINSGATGESANAPSIGGVQSVPLGRGDGGGFGGYQMQQGGYFDPSALARMIVASIFGGQ